MENLAPIEGHGVSEGRLVGEDARSAQSIPARQIARQKKIHTAILIIERKSRFNSNRHQTNSNGH